MNSNEKCNIRTLTMFILSNNETNVMIKRVNTGSNIYTVVVEHKPNHGVIYSVSKTAKNGKYLGVIQLHKVSDYGCEYDASKFTLPDSVLKYIRAFNRTLNMYIKYGDKAFN